MQHPSLSGHFPGRPIVPGVVILGEVIGLFRELAPESIPIGLPSVKFVSPLEPSEALTIRVELNGGDEVIFSSHVGARLVACGTIKIRVDTIKNADRR